MSTPSFMNVCRLCLVKDKVSIPIFEGEGEVRQIFMKIVTCLPVKVEKNDRLPKKICDVCLYNVENVFKFWHTTASSEKKLLQWLEGTEKLNDVSVNNGSSTIETEQVMLKEETVEQEHVSELSKSQENECSQDCMERSDVEDSNSDEEGFNSEEETINDNVGEKEVRRKDEAESEEDYGELEPTTFVNVTLACEDQPGPSGLQSGQSLEQHVQPVQRLERVQPKVTQVVLQTVPSLQTIQVPPALAVQPGQPIPEAVPSTSKTVPASSGSSLITVEKSWNSTDQEKRITTCEFCGKHFSVRCLAADHRRIHTGEKPFLCHICGERFRTLARLRRHVQNHSEDRPFKCDMCHWTFKTNFELKAHKKRHTEEKKYVCDVCGYSCKEKIGLTLHRQRHFKKYKFVCNQCNKGFYQQSALAEHMVKHDLGDTKPFKCEQCGSGYSSKNYLSIHVRTRHNPDFRKPECGICHKTVASKQVLKRHMKAHTGMNRLVCDTCGKILSSAEGLKVHIRTHTGEKPSICNVCGKAFSSRNYLRTHSRVHTGDKPFLCKECGKSFTQRSTLVVHMRSHTGERPYPCTVCGKSYVTKTLLKAHGKSHLQL